MTRITCPFRHQPDKTKPHHMGGEHHIFKFDNGYGASVVRFLVHGEPGSYGSGEGLWELAVLRGGRLCYSTPVTDDVLGWLDEDAVDAALDAIDALPAEAP